MLLQQMLKRQDSLLSSSRRETLPPQKHHVAATSVGCISGIFHLITKYQNRSKRITSSGRKHKKSNISDGTCSSPKNANHKVSRTTQTSPSSKEVPRSPSTTNRPETCGLKGHRKQPTLVARLMGLEDIPGNMSPCNNIVVEREESDEGKRRKLLQALERCNDDLATLRKVIKNVQEVEKSVQLPQTTVEVGIKESGDSEHQRLSRRACVIDQRFRSPTINNPVATSTSPGEETTPPPSKPPTMRKNPRHDDGIETYFFHKKSLANKSWDIKHEISSPQEKPGSSKAMIESVEQVCRDIAWGEKREAEKIGLMVQECIWKDLIEEIVQEMTGCWIYVLPFEACRRRLTFF